jgi:hypothetical protein
VKSMTQSRSSVLGGRQGTPHPCLVLPVDAPPASPRQSPSREEQSSQSSLDSVFCRSPETVQKTNAACLLGSVVQVVVLNFNGESVGISFHSDSGEETKKIKDILSGNEGIKDDSKVLKFNPLPGTYLPTCLPTCLPTYLRTYLPAYLPSYMPTNLLPAYLPASLRIYLPTCLPPCLFTYLLKFNPLPGTYLPAYLPS